jgi:hypothetical protein
LKKKTKRSRESYKKTKWNIKNYVRGEKRKMRNLDEKGEVG